MWKFAENRVPGIAGSAGDAAIAMTGRLACAAH